MEDDLAAVRRLCSLLADVAADWGEFLGAVATTRGAA
jgi:hypothetical protein